MPAIESRSEQSRGVHSGLPNIFFVRWSLGEALGIGAGFIVVMAAVGYLARTDFITGYFGETAALFILLPAVDIVLCGVIAWRVCSRGGAAALGLHRSGLMRSLWRGLAVGLFCMPALWALLVANSVIAHAFGVEVEPHPLMKTLEASVSPAFSAWLILYAVLVRPVVEEVYFRGFLYPALRSAVSPGVAIFLNAVLFAAPHPQVTALMPLAALGALLAWMYERTGSLAAPVAMHVLNNGLAIAIFFLTQRFLQI